MKRTLLFFSIVSLLAPLLTSPGSQAADSQAETKEKVVWDYWYTVSVRSIPAEIYNDKVVLHHDSHGDKIQFFNHVWKKEEGYINEEQLGAFANADMAMTPLFFNYRSTYRTTETVVDGNVHDGKMLVVNVRKAGQSIPAVKHSIAANTFFSVFFPLWIGKEIKTLKAGQGTSFNTIFEDDIDNGFESQSGTMRIEKPDELAGKTQTTKLAVDIHDMRTYWWVDSHGAAVHTESPQTGAVIDRVTKEKAQAFLGQTGSGQ